MTRHLIVTSTLGLLLATSTFAQTAADPVQPDMTAAANWPVGVTTVFFADQTMTTLRAADEMRAQWATLSETDQTRVKQDCAAIRADAGTTGGAATGGISDAGATVPAGEDNSAAGDAMTGTGSGSGGDLTQGDASSGGTVNQGSDGFIDDDAEGTSSGVGRDATTGTFPDTTGGATQTGTTGEGMGTVEGSAATDTTLAERSGMTTSSTSAGAAGSISTENLTEICALVNTL